MQNEDFKMFLPNQVEDSYVDPEIGNDAKTADYMLAHPYRIQKFAGEVPDTYKRVLGQKEWDTLLESFKSDNFVLANIMELCRRKGMRKTEMLIEMAAHTPGSTEIGGAMPMLAGLRHLTAPYRIFRLDDDLIDLLNLTDVAEDVPLSFLKMPFSRCYVELGTKRNTGYTVLNEESGLHELEGAYLEEGTHPQRGKGLYVMFTGSPIGKKHVMDDATSSIFLSMEDPSVRIQDELRAAFVQAKAQAEQAGYRLPLEQDGAEQNIQLICKALLYIGLPDIRKTMAMRHTELAKQLQTLKSPGKRAKAERQLQKANDEIWVHAPAGQPSVSQAAEAGHGKASHWRRGHYRNQRYGQELAFSRIVFIAPVLVNSANATEDAKPKTYRVS